MQNTVIICAVSGTMVQVRCLAIYITWISRSMCSSDSHDAKVFTGWKQTNNNNLGGSHPLPVLYAFLTPLIMHGIGVR